MQAIMETSFDVVYLISVITIGILMVAKAKGNKEYTLFGIMAITLGAGDAFHLVPRAVALCTTGLENFTVALGIGKFITSITMTVFTSCCTTSGAAAITSADKRASPSPSICCPLCASCCASSRRTPWTSADAPLSWGILRNIPFALLGLLIIVLFYQSAKKHNDRSFGWMWLTIVLSFGFYIPVVLWADTIPMIGMLMIPKTCAYVWTVLIGFLDMKRAAKA